MGISAVGVTLLAAMAVVACNGDSEGGKPPVATPPPVTPAGVAVDVVRAAGSWWGVTLADFPKVAGLKAGDYQQGEKPLNKDVTVIVPIARRTQGRWVPEDLPPFSFEFTEGRGLVEIGGFTKGKDNDAVIDRLVARYGKYTSRVSAVGLTTYGWEFDRTSLEVSGGFFWIRPR
jgi:hypothetical protein